MIRLVAVRWCSDWQADLKLLQRSLLVASCWSYARFRYFLRWPFRNAALCDVRNLPEDRAVAFIAV